jgi:L-fucose isomerase-like protein
LEKIKVCAVSTIQPSFWGSARGEFLKVHMPRLRELESILGFSLFWIEKPVILQEEAEKAVSEAREKGADFLLIQATTFASGGVIVPFAQSGIPLGIWGIPEITDTGAIPYNSFCGINMFASIIKQYVGKDIPYKWFFGNVDDELFLERFKVTLKALGAAKKIPGSRIALIGGVAPGFYDLAFDESKLMERLGVQIFPHEFAEVKDLALSYSENAAKEQLKKFQSGCVFTAGDLAAEGLLNMARVYLALNEITLKNSYDSIAIGCWPKYRKELGIVVCAVIGRLLEDGILVACEGDIESLITMMMLHQLSGGSAGIPGSMPMLMDMSKFDAKDNSVLMWHCGSAPNCYADLKGVSLEGHYKPGSRITAEDNIRVAGVHDMYYRSQEVTIARLSGNGEKLLVFSGDFIEKTDRSYDGSRGWIGNLSMEGKALPVRDLLETVMSRGLQHHYAICSGGVETEMRELAAWLDIEELGPVPYSNSMRRL